MILRSAHIIYFKKCVESKVYWIKTVMWMNGIYNFKKKEPTKLQNGASQNI